MNKRDMARYKDCDFRDENYLWVLGIDVFERLQSTLETYTYFTSVDTSDRIIRQFMGIKVQIDYDRKNIIKLYKEV
jgi:hypothetical protein